MQDNPFVQLKQPDPKKMAYDEWGGQFSCQTRDCYEVSDVARYYNKQRVLAWKCANGHVSKIEDVDE